MCGKIMTVLLIFVVLNYLMVRYNGRLHCIVGVLPTCYKRKAATYFYPPGGTGPKVDWLFFVLVLTALADSISVYIGASPRGRGITRGPR